MNTPPVRFVINFHLETLANKFAWVTLRPQRWALTSVERDWKTKNASKVRIKGLLVIAIFGHNSRFDEQRHQVSIIITITIIIITFIIITMINNWKLPSCEYTLDIPEMSRTSEEAKELIRCGLHFKNHHHHYQKHHHHHHRHHHHHDHNVDKGNFCWWSLPNEYQLQNVFSTPGCLGLIST